MAKLAEPQKSQDFRQEWNRLSHDNTVRLYAFAGRPTRRQVLLRDCESQTEHRFSISPFVYLTDGDRIRIEYGSDGAVVRMDKLLHVAGRSTSVDEAAIFPYYAHREALALVTGKQIPVMFKEVTTEDEFQQLRFLEQFHYLQAKPAWGRQMYLLVAPEADEVLGTPLPGVLGCVVLTSPSLLSGPRNNLLDWNDRNVLKEHVDRVVRIARVIVHPEFRGLRIGAKLVQHAVAYCRERWNVKGKKAWFIETVAEMSRYHPFFEQGGLRFIGETKAEDSAVFFDDDPKRLGIDQGEGQVMASIRRFKQKVRTRKPYLMASLLPAEDPLTSRIEGASPQPLASGPTNLVLNPLSQPMVFNHVTAAYTGRTVWEEPEELNSKWLEASHKSRSDLGAYMFKLSSLVNELLDDELWKADAALEKELRPILRRIDTKVQDGCSSLELMTVESERLLADISSSLDAILRHRHELLGSLKSTRSGIEQAIKPINENAEALRERGEQLPPELSRRRTALNEVRLHLQRVESKLELGAASSPQRWVTDAFGVRPGQGTVTLRDFNLEIWPGSIVLVIGPSGSGKSTLLSLLSGTLKPTEGHITPLDLPQHVSVLDLNFDPSRPLIDLVGRDEKEAVYLLNHVDLAEAHLYIKRRDQLSHGQRYRAAFAQMLADRQPVWVADEFCAFLDPVTTLTLCKGIRKLIQRQKITFVAAAAKEDYIREALQPDIVIRINAGGQITPAPKPQHWTIGPTKEQLLQAFQGNPDDLPIALERWLRQLSLIENDPLALSGTRLTGAAQRLRETASAEPEQFFKALADHLWAQDWLFHRVWNRLVHPDAFPSADDWAATEKPAQLRYRQALAWSLHPGWPL